MNNDQQQQTTNHTYGAWGENRYLFVAGWPRDDRKSSGQRWNRSTLFDDRFRLLLKTLNSSFRNHFQRAVTKHTHYKFLVVLDAGCVGGEFALNLVVLCYAFMTVMIYFGGFEPVKRPCTQLRFLMISILRRTLVCINEGFTGSTSPKINALSS